MKNSSVSNKIGLEKVFIQLSTRTTWALRLLAGPFILHWVTPIPLLAAEKAKKKND
jgi:hypothetical protein